jgi:hypothetical protein
MRAGESDRNSRRIDPTFGEKGIAKRYHADRHEKGIKIRRRKSLL